MTSLSLAHDRVGAGPPVILLHPLGADRHVWDAVAERLAASYEVISLDLPGFGSSEPVSEEPTPRTLAGAVAGFLSDAGVQQPHVVGNSLGGWVGLELGLAEAVASVVAIAPAGLWPRPLGPRPGFARLLSRAGLPLVVPATLSARGRRLLLSGSVARPDLVPARAAAHLIRSYATAPDFERVNSAMRAGVFSRLRDITVPVTLVWPEHDGLVGRPRQLPPNIVNVPLPGAGHIPMLDQPDRVAALIHEAISGATEFSSDFLTRTGHGSARTSPPATDQSSR
jgi:pimeloyl-ACP methyl ester carboxylesterase